MPESSSPSRSAGASSCSAGSCNRCLSRVALSLTGTCRCLPATTRRTTLSSVTPCSRLPRAMRPWGLLLQRPQKVAEVAIEAARAESLPPSRVNRQVEKGSSQGAPIAPSPLILLSERCPTQFLEPRSFRKSRLGGGHSTKCGVGDDHVHLLNSESCLLKR